MRLHVKVVVWLSDLNALLTKTLPKILSPLNETSCGREKMCLVSGSVRRILHRVAAIFKTKKKKKKQKETNKKGPHFLAFVAKVEVVTTEASQSEKLRYTLSTRN